MGKGMRFFTRESGRRGVGLSVGGGVVGRVSRSGRVGVVGRTVGRGVRSLPRDPGRCGDGVVVVPRPVRVARHCVADCSMMRLRPERSRVRRAWVG